MCNIWNLIYPSETPNMYTHFFSCVQCFFSCSFFPSLHTRQSFKPLPHHVKTKKISSLPQAVCVQCRQSCPELCCDQKNILVPISLCCRWTISTCFHARHTHFSLHHELVPQAHKTGSSVAFQSYRNCRVNWVIVGRISHHYKLSLKI